MLTFKEAKSQLSSQQKSTNLIHNCLFLSRVPFKEISCTRTFQETSLRPCYDMLKTRDSEWLNYYLFTFERSAQGRWVCNDACNLVRALVCREYLHEFLKKETKLKRFFFSFQIARLCFQSSFASTRRNTQRYKNIVFCC